jgi:hypothetical protein
MNNSRELWRLIIVFSEHPQFKFVVFRNPKLIYQMNLTIIADNREIASGILVLLAEKERCCR